MKTTKLQGYEISISIMLVTLINSIFLFYDFLAHLSKDSFLEIQS